jgi:hypothetical protein
MAQANPHATQVILETINEIDRKKKQKLLVEGNVAMW